MDYRGRLDKGVGEAPASLAGLLSQPSYGRTGCAAGRTPPRGNP